MFQGRIEMPVVEAPSHQMGVSLAQLPTGIVVGAAKAHGQEGIQLGALGIHVDALKKLVDPVIGQNLLIE